MTQFLICHLEFTAFYGLNLLGSISLYYLMALFFIISSLGVGLAVSSFSKSQFQAANLANTYILPSILFSGFLFPTGGMPLWAQWIGNILPSTHFFRLTTDIMIKNSDFKEIWPELWPMIVFMLGIILLSYKFYRNTLD